MPLAKALASGAMRAPPPKVSLERADPGSGAAWAVTMRPCQCHACWRALKQA